MLSFNNKQLFFKTSKQKYQTKDIIINRILEQKNTTLKDILSNEINELNPYIVNVPIDTGNPITKMAVVNLLVGKFSFNTLINDDHNTAWTNPLINQYIFSISNDEASVIPTNRFINPDNNTATLIAYLGLYFLHSKPWTTCPIP